MIIISNNLKFIYIFNKNSLFQIKKYYLIDVISIFVLINQQKNIKTADCSVALPQFNIGL